jgi:hypothetical protein
MSTKLPHVVICHGLFQPEDISNGLGKELLPALLMRREQCVVVGSRVFGWREDEKIEAIARELVALGAPVILIGHSYGVWWCNELACEIESQGGEVYALLSCDGVQGPRPKNALHISPAVRRLYYWFQTRNWKIKGSPIIYDVRKTELVYYEEVTDGRRHARMDEYEPFQAMCLQVVREAHENAN